MARVHTLKAAKDYPEIGVVKGDTYYKWSRKIPSGGGWRSATFKSKTYPKRSRLTSSEFLGAVYDLEDQISDAESPDDLEGFAEDARGIGSEQEEKFENLPEGLQGSSTGELLQERAQQCEEWANQIEEAANAWRDAIEAADDDDEENEDPDEVDGNEFTGDCMYPG